MEYTILHNFTFKFKKWKKCLTKQIDFFCMTFWHVVHILDTNFKPNEYEKNQPNGQKEAPFHCNPK
jgi:hypothetical protein